MQEFDLNGAIVPTDDAWIYDWFGMENVSPAKVKDFLTDAGGEDVVININSGGGDVYSGINIHDMLKSYSGNVEVHICGIAASAATIVSMAGRCLMSRPSLFMIHNTACEDHGNKEAKVKTADMLGVHDRAIAQLYAAKTGIEMSELLKMMKSETWLDAQTALDKGFIDGIIDETASVRVTNAFGSGLLPQSTIDAVRKKKQKQQETGVTAEQLRKRLNLLRRM